MVMPSFPIRNRVTTAHVKSNGVGRCNKISWRLLSMTILPVGGIHKLFENRDIRTQFMYLHQPLYRDSMCVRVYLHLVYLCREERAIERKKFRKISICLAKKSSVEEQINVCKEVGVTRAYLAPRNRQRHRSPRTASGNSPTTNGGRICSLLSDGRYDSNNRKYHLCELSK